MGAAEPRRGRGGDGGSCGRVPLVPIDNVPRPLNRRAPTAVQSSRSGVGTHSLSRHTRGEHGQRKIAQGVPAGRLAVSHQSRRDREYRLNRTTTMLIRVAVRGSVYESSVF